ncbi:hypothetical protein [Coraliomargarita parva]|uniref:hypothetical protein n=1 Tax=Coraliomargarita parva TaxID=3014050 RepID=UPI0022B2D942|nr:hypothetical protein [Coraliomargarita parva]
MYFEIGFVLVLAFALAYLFWTLVRKASVKIQAQFEQLSEAYGLELNIPAPQLLGMIRPEPSVFGSHRGRELSISVPGRGLQNTRQIETVLKVELRDKALAAQFAPAGLLSGLSQRDSKGKPRWKSGDTAFDAAVDVRTDMGPRVASLLNEERRAWIFRQVKEAKANLYFGGGVLSYTELGLMADDARRERFESAIAFFCDLADTIEGK